MKRWFILVFAASLPSLSAAQTKPSIKKPSTSSTVQQGQKNQVSTVTQVKQESKKPPIVKFSMDMIESGHIPLGYTGFAVADIVDAIERMTGDKKGEFESSAEYNARKSVALSGKVIGDSTVNDLFALVLPVGKGGRYRSGVGYEFNADTSEVRLFALPKSSSMNGIGAPDYQTNRRESKGLDQFDFDFKLNSKSTYQGSNAYGATITVEKTNSTRLGVAANRIPFLNFKREIVYSNPTPVAQLTLENSKAAKELPALKALVVMKMTAPYIAYDFFHSDPTRDSPNDMTSQGKYLTGDILGIVFYSGITGDVLARIPETFGLPETKPELSADAKPEGQ